MLNKTEIGRLRADLSELVAELLPQKTALRRRWPGPMREVQASVLALAREITELSILLAWCRGRRHLTAAPRWLRDLGRAHELEDVQCRIAERVADRYRESSPAPQEAAR
jgi:hypothetical protein